MQRSQRFGCDPARPEEKEEEEGEEGSCPRGGGVGGWEERGVKPGPSARRDLDDPGMWIHTSTQADVFFLSSENLLNISCRLSPLPSDGSVDASRGPNISTGSRWQLFI